MYKAAFRQAGKSGADFTDGAFTLCPCLNLSPEVHRMDQAEVTQEQQEHQHLWEAHFVTKKSPSDRLTFDPLENFRFCNTQQSCWTFQHFKMNLNIDVSLASTPRESFARVQGPSQCTATLPALDKLRTNCRFIWVPKCCCQKVCADLRHSGKSTMILNGKTTISAEPENPIKDP